LERCTGGTHVALDARAIVAPARAAGRIGGVFLRAFLVHVRGFCLGTGRAFGAAEPAK
jgi:hypothetical protein